MDAEILIKSTLEGADLGVNIIAFSEIPQKLPLPVVTYQRISSIPIDTTCLDVPAEYVRMQVNCWANSYGDAVALFRSVQLALIGTGKAEYLNRIDDREETGYYRIIADYQIFQEA